MRLRSVFGFLSPRLRYSEDELPLEEFPIAERMIVLVAAGGGELSLKVGDRLKTGEKVFSKGGDVLGFSSVTGTVKETYGLRWSGGDEFTAIVIEASSEDEWDASLQGMDFSGKEPGEIVSFLHDAGFSVNLEGAERVIVNCLEGDLLISNNQRILREYGDRIKAGIGLLRGLVASGSVIVVIPPNLREVAEGIVSDGGERRADIVVVDSVHPNGMEQMVLRLLGLGGRSVIIGVEYLVAMVGALETGHPFIEKMITLVEKGGRPVKNIRVRVGTPIAEIIRANNIPVEDNDRVVLGGPMTGRSVYRLDFPITHDTDAVFIQGCEEVVPIDNAACLNCGACVRVCPYNLQVNLLSRYCEFSIFERCEELDIDFCIECGLCAYVCTSRRPLVQYIQFAKRELEKIREEEAREEEEEKEEVTA
jgi:electron transport complex protein RnfC